MVAQRYIFIPVRSSFSFQDTLAMLRGDFGRSFQFGEEDVLDGRMDTQVKLVLVFQSSALFYFLFSLFCLGPSRNLAIASVLNNMLGFGVPAKLVSC